MSTAVPGVRSRIVVGLAVALAVTGCGGGAASTASPTDPYPTSAPLPPSNPVPRPEQYAINTTSANEDPEAYYDGYRQRIGLEPGDRDAVATYFEINNATKSGQLDQLSGLNKMQNFLGAELGPNLAAFGNALYLNRDLTPKELDDAITYLSPYVFWSPDGFMMRESLRQFAHDLWALPEGLHLYPTFSPNGGEGQEFNIFVSFGRIEDANTSYVAVVNKPGTQEPIVFRGSPGGVKVNEDGLTMVGTAY